MLPNTAIEPRLPWFKTDGILLKPLVVDANKRAADVNNVKFDYWSKLINSSLWFEKCYLWRALWCFYKLLTTGNELVRLICVVVCRLLIVLATTPIF